MRLTPRRLAPTPAAAPVPASTATWGDRVSQYARLITGVVAVIAVVAQIVIVAIGSHVNAHALAAATAVTTVCILISSYLSRNTELIDDLADAADDLQDITRGSS